ncbi:MAG TPA: SMP-30/gluconolactonase/LRE family protein [Kiritimatiellia bacterium]|nr:SMP-30/gluconolactonase/LRE family protein [Kiritimatiellia bacterium]HRU70385.1 SMP-30/gluconolactonase/LRE family protein [Kiritimatiellia bacterium]
MKLGLIGLVSGMMAVCATAAGLDDVIAPGTVAEKLADGFKFTEGATVNAAGEVFFVDQPNNKILRWSREQGLLTFMEPAGRANGMCFAPDGNLLVCADEKTELWSVTPDGKVTVLANAYGGKPLNGPNDVWACPQGGGCYFTDPFYKRSWWSHTEPPQVTQQVYFLPKGGQPRRVTEDLEKPNGIVGTPDGKRLFVADIQAKKVYAYAIQPDGALADKRLFCEMGSDGMTLDADGRLYLTNKEGVYVYDKAGVFLGVIKIPEPWCGNACIGGPNKDTLFVTASKGFYAVPLKVKGTLQGK